MGSSTMDHIRNSNLEEYACQFWSRERPKGFDNTEIGFNNQDAYAGIERGEECLLWLRRVHDYKVPVCAKGERPYIVKIVSLRRSELADLVVHDYMINNQWFSERHLILDPKSSRLGDISAVAIEREYFEGNYDETQIKCWKAWKGGNTLLGCIGQTNMPLVEVNSEGKCEIVDGFGRLLAYEALVHSGFTYHPVPVFLAKYL